MSDIIIKAEKRIITTKGAVNQLRRDGKIPGVLYSKEMEPVNFTVTELSINPLVYTTDMHLVDLTVEDGKAVKSILKNVQFDPLTDKIIHIDFQAITVGQAIQVQVPISIVGQAIGVKSGGMIQQTINKLDIDCLPKHIPQNLEIDITSLDVGDAIRVGDLSYENITILNSVDTRIISVAAAREEEEEEVATELLETEDEGAEPELINKGKSEEESEES